MKFLIVFAAALAAASAGFVAPVVYSTQHLPVIGPNGVPIDTPAVQQATAAHLAHKAEAQERNGDIALVAPIAHAPVVAADPVISAHGLYGQPAAYPTTLGIPAVTADGIPLETPEVVAAKTKHFAAHGEALARTGHAAVGVVTPVHHLHRRSPIYSPYAYGAYPYAAIAHATYPHYY